MYSVVVNINNTDLSETRVSLFCPDTRSPRHSCPLCPSQHQTSPQSLWSSLQMKSRKMRRHMNTLLPNKCHMTFKINFTKMTR